MAQVLDGAWNAARELPGFLTEAEGRFLGLAAACTPASGAIVEIGSFKGKSTVILAAAARRYGLGLVTAIDPHTFDCPEFAEHRAVPGATSHDDFVRNLETAGVRGSVDIRRAYSTNVARQWTSPIRFLWIDGDHTYAGATADFDGFMPHMVPGGVVAFHDALHLFSGPIRVFVEDVLRSDRFGAAGFVGSIAWAQFRPDDGAQFRWRRKTLAQSAERLLPYVADERKPQGLGKLAYKLARARVPRAAMPPEKWAALLDDPHAR